VRQRTLEERPNTYGNEDEIGLMQSIRNQLRIGLREQGRVPLNNPAWDFFIALPSCVLNQHPTNVVGEFRSGGNGIVITTINTSYSSTFVDDGLHSCRVHTGWDNDVRRLTSQARKARNRATVIAISGRHHSDRGRRTELFKCSMYGPRSAQRLEGR
jgi:hypothetical protein